MCQSPRFGQATLYHVSPGRNYASILKNGVLMRKARGPFARIWLCTADRLIWALDHVSAHHGLASPQMCVFEVTVARRKIRRYRRGVYLCKTDIRPDQITVVREA